MKRSTRLWVTAAIFLTRGPLDAQESLSSSARLTEPGEPGTPLTVSGLVRDSGGRAIPGVTLHVYQMDVRAPGRPERRFQLVFADDSLLRDPYWADWVRTLRQPVLTVRRAGERVAGTVTLTLD